MTATIRIRQVLCNASEMRGSHRFPFPMHIIPIRKRVSLGRSLVQKLLGWRRGRHPRGGNAPRGAEDTRFRGRSLLPVPGSRGSPRRGVEGMSFAGPPAGGQQQHGSNTVFVGNVPYTATEEQLIEVFESAGQVVSFRCVRAILPPSHRGRKFAQAACCRPARAPSRA